jgi:hypothetical protein
MLQWRCFIQYFDILGQNVSFERIHGGYYQEEIIATAVVQVATYPAFYSFFSALVRYIN